MPLRANGQRSQRSFIPKAEQGDFVHVKDGKNKIEGTVISKSATEIVVSHRGKYGAPQLHIIKIDKPDVVVAPTTTKKITYRNDASSFVDPFRKRALTSGLEDIKSQNALDFSVQGYDVKKDEFYIEGRLNAGAPFGKWVSAKDLIPLMDVHARKGASTDELIRTFAAAIGQAGSLTERPKKVEETPKEEAKKDETGKQETTAEPTTESGAKNTSLQDDNDESHAQEQVSPSLIEKLKTLRDQPAQNDTAPTRSPEQKRNSRPDLKDTKSYVNDRIAALKGKAGGSETGQAGGPTAQAARNSIILGDVAFTSGAAVPALVFAYANAGAGQSPAASQAAWQQAMRQMQDLSNGLNTRLSERRAQFEVLSLAGAPSALLEQSRGRVSALETAGAQADQTLSVARGRRSAQELAGLQTARQITSKSGGSSVADGRSIQSTLAELRAKGIGQGGAPGIGTDSSQRTAQALGSDVTVEIQQEIAFETAAQTAITQRLQALQGELQTLRDQIASAQAENAEAQAGLQQTIASAEELLATLQTAQSAQAERLSQAQQALVQAQTALATLPTTSVRAPGEGSSIPDGPGTQAVKTFLRNQVATPPDQSNTTSGARTARPGGSPTGVPTIPAIPRGGASVQNGTSTGTATGNGAGTARKPTTVLGGRGGVGAGAIRPLSPLPLGGVAGEVATLQRDRQVADRQGGNRYDEDDTAVTDLPQRRWSNSDDAEDVDPDDVEDDNEDAAFRQSNQEANQYAEQFGNKGEDSDEDGNQFADSSSFAKRALGAAVAGEALPGNLQEGALQDIDNFRMLASAKALTARSQELRAQNANQVSAAKIASGKKKRMEAIEKEIETKTQDIIGLGGFEAIIPVLKYLGTVFISAANRKAGAYALQILPGYRPKLPEGAEPDGIEQQWDIFLGLEFTTVVIGMIAGFLLFIGSQLIMFFFFFGPLIGAIVALCSLFGGTCSS